MFLTNLFGIIALFNATLVERDRTPVNSLLLIASNLEESSDVDETSNLMRNAKSDCYSFKNKIK